jgi:hypothetical protein
MAGFLKQPVFGNDGRNHRHWTIYPHKTQKHQSFSNVGSAPHTRYPRVSKEILLERRRNSCFNQSQGYIASPHLRQWYAHKYLRNARAPRISLRFQRPHIGFKSWRGRSNAETNITVYCSWIDCENFEDHDILGHTRPLRSLKKGPAPCSCSSFCASCPTARGGKRLLKQASHGYPDEKTKLDLNVRSGNESEAGNGFGHSSVRQRCILSWLFTAWQFFFMFLRLRKENGAQLTFCTACLKTKSQDPFSAAPRVPIEWHSVP